MHGPQRGHFLIIFDKLFQELRATAAIVLLVLFVRRDFTTLIIFGVMVASILIRLIVKLILFRHTTYEITEDMFYVNKGVLNKQKIEIPLETITTVNLNQDLIFQWAKVCKIRVETTVQYTGTSTGDPNTILALKKDEAENFKELILKNRELKLAGLEEKEGEGKRESQGLRRQELEMAVESAKSYSDVRQDFPRVKVSASKIVLFGLLQSKWSYILILIAAVASGVGTLQDFAGEYIMELIHKLNLQERALEVTTSFLENNIGTMVLIGALLLLVIGIVLFFISIILSVGFTVIRYWGFNIEKDEKAITINYGIISKKRFSLTNEKISGVKLKQSFLMKLFGQYTVEVYAIGYGNEEGAASSAMLFPIGKKDDIEKIMEDFLPEIEVQRDYKREKNGTLRYFFFNFGIFATSTLTIIWLAFALVGENKTLFILAPVVAIGLLSQILRSILKYNSEKISIRDKSISYIKGGYGRQIIFLKRDLIETASFKTSIFKSKKAIGHIVLQFFGPLQFSKGRADNFRWENYEEIRGKIQY